MARRFTITAALPYSNGPLHVGQIAGCYLPADTYARYLKSHGDDVAFICGSDDYGVPVLLTSRAEGRPPREVAAHYREVQRLEYAGLGIRFDVYSGTCSTDIHTELSQQFFLRCLENGHLEKRTSRQLYDVEAGMFLPDRYVEGTCHHCGSGGARGDQCESCGRMVDQALLVQPRSVITGTTPELRETVHWFFRLPAFEDRLRDWISGHEEWRPMVRNFTLGLLQQGLPERAITRDIDWGIPVPLPDDPDARDKVLYVWFDAPIGYVSFTEQWCRERGLPPGSYESYWKDPDCSIVHFIGEDNVVFHALTWPAMLMAEGSFQLPRNIPANCFLNIQFPGQDEEKMSTSRGTAVWIGEYLRRYQPDPLRYYLTMVAPERQRTAFRFEDLVQRNNAELVAALGNLVHRVMTFAHRYCGGRVPPAGSRTDADNAQADMVRRLPDAVAACIEEFRLKDGLGEVMAAARETNRYFDYREPWMLRKHDMAACGSVINVCLGTIKTLGVVMEPYLPFAAGKVAGMLSAEPDELRWAAAAGPVPEGRQLGEPVILFDKIEEAPAAEEGTAP